MSRLKRLARTTDGSAAWGLLLLRLWFGLSLALNHGWPKAMGFDRFVANVAKQGFPVPSAFAVGAAASELVGGLLLAVGLLTRPAAVSVAVTMLVAAFVIHGADPFTKKELALGYATAAIALLVAGPGKLSLDVKLSS